MDWINYHHLLYFWVTAREGSITRASQRLRLAQPTVSGQIQSLEKSVGEPLFLRQGRRLVLTETGKLVLGYADQIFTAGQELVDTLRNRPTDGRQRVAIGIADRIPTQLVHTLLAPTIGPQVQLVCQHGSGEQLLDALAEFDLDLVICDVPMHRDETPRTSQQVLGASPVALFGTVDLVNRLRPGFPNSLDGAPLLLPTGTSPLRRALDGYFGSTSVTPQIIAEFDDPGLMAAFGQSGAGLFPALTGAQGETGLPAGIVPLRELPELRSPFYALTVERKIENPLVQRIIANARERLTAPLEASA